MFLKKDQCWSIWINSLCQSMLINRRSGASWSPLKSIEFHWLASISIDQYWLDPHWSAMHGHLRKMPNADQCGSMLINTVQCGPIFTQKERLSKRRQKRIHNQNVVVMTIQIWYQMDWYLVVKVVMLTTLTTIKFWQLWRHKVVKSCQSENSDNNWVVTSQQPKVVFGPTLTTLTTLWRCWQLYLTTFWQQFAKTGTIKLQPYSLQSDNSWVVIFWQHFDDFDDLWVTTLLLGVAKTGTIKLQP